MSRYGDAEGMGRGDLGGAQGYEGHPCRGVRMRGHGVGTLSAGCGDTGDRGVAVRGDGGHRETPHSRLSRPGSLHPNSEVTVTVSLRPQGPPSSLRVSPPHPLPRLQRRWSRPGSSPHEGDVPASPGTPVPSRACVPPLTDVAVAEALELAGLLAARGGGDGGRQLAQVRLADVQGDVGRGAHLQVGQAQAVVTCGDGGQRRRHPKNTLRTAPSPLGTLDPLQGAPRTTHSTWGCPPARTGDAGGEGAPRDVLVVVLHHDAVVPGQHRQVGDAARPILVVGAADLRLGGTLHSQRQTSWGVGGGHVGFRGGPRACWGGPRRLADPPRGSPSPASLVLTVKVAGLLTVPWMRPGP